VYSSSGDANSRPRESEMAHISKTIASISMEVTIPLSPVLVKLHLHIGLDFGLPAIRQAWTSRNKSSYQGD